MGLGVRRRAEKWIIQTEGGANSLPSCSGIRRTRKRHTKTESILLYLSLAQLSGAQRKDGSPPHSLAPRSPHPSAGLLVRSGAGRGGQPPRAAAIPSFRLLPLFGLRLQLGEGRGLGQSRACLRRGVGVGSRGRSGRRGRGAGQLQRWSGGGRGAGSSEKARRRWSRRRFGVGRLALATLEVRAGAGAGLLAPFLGRCTPVAAVPPAGLKCDFPAVPLSASFFSLTGLSGRRAPGGQVVSPRVGARPGRSPGAAAVAREARSWGCSALRS